ncbi:MAG TPA: bifunctional 4-hydroxy-2-oxoglutarate aldolase/2-dehydro-3-deoxy-phosphogluconate aldolase [Vicinamibacterales bacterium]
MTATLTRVDVVRRIEAEGVVAVVRLADPRAGQEVAAALLEGGVSAIEITMTVPRAVEVIAELSSSMPDALIGAGTVTSAAMARAVMSAGARFVVSPIFKPEIIAACHGQEVPAFPGCFSPTEIAAAFELDADIIKVFPATSLGPSYIKDLRGPFPALKLMPTGGVSRDNAADWIRAGAVAIGAGTALVDPRAVEARRFEVITANARAFTTAVRGAR